MKIRKLPSGSYNARVYVGTVNGVKKFKSITAPTQAEVRYLAAQYEHTHRELTTDMTVGEAAQRFVEERKPFWSYSYACLAETTLRTRYRALQGIKISRLTRQLVQQAVSDEAKQINARTGKPISAKTVCDAFSFFKEAVQRVDKYIIDWDEIVLPKKQKPSYNTPDGATLADIYAAVKDTPAELPVYLASQMSLRRSEILGLKWSDISPDGSVLHVQRAKVRGQYKDPKTETSDRYIPITPDVKRLLDAREREGEYIFNCCIDYYTDAYRESIKKAGISPVKFHELRHAFASNAMALGIPDKYIMAIGGWSTPVVMRNVYQQTFEKNKQDAMAKMSQFYEKLK
jgi:integrase